MAVSRISVRLQNPAYRSARRLNLVNLVLGLPCWGSGPRWQTRWMPEHEPALPSTRQQYVPPPVQKGIPSADWVSFADAGRELGIKTWRVRVRALDPQGHLDGRMRDDTGTL